MPKLSIRRSLGAKMTIVITLIALIIGGRGDRVQLRDV